MSNEKKPSIRTMAAVMMGALAWIRDKFDTAIVGEVAEERARQDLQWGGEETDATRSAADWACYIHKQAAFLRSIEPDNLTGQHERLIKIIALAWAALEQIRPRMVDKVRQGDTCSCPACELRRELEEAAAGTQNFGQDPNIEMYVIDGGSPGAILEQLFSRRRG